MEGTVALKHALVARGILVNMLLFVHRYYRWSMVPKKKFMLLCVQLTCRALNNSGNRKRKQYSKSLLLMVIAFLSLNATLTTTATFTYNHKVAHCLHQPIVAPGYFE